MKFIIRLFFKTLRWLIGPLLLLWEKLSRPQGLVRSPTEQAVVDQRCVSLVLYQYKTCPFCIKVRQEMARLSLKIERLDAQPEGMHRQNLQQGGGQTKVPCLKITDAQGRSEWLYESGQIINYLRSQFA